MLRLLVSFSSALLLLLSASFAHAAVPSPAMSTFPSCVVTCPRGDIPITVTLRDAAGTPCGGVPVSMLMNGPCVSGPCFPPPSPFPFYTVITNAAGVGTFNVRLGGCCAGGNVQFFDAAGTLLATVTPGYHSPDLNGDCAVNLVDLGVFAGTFTTGYGRCEDFNCDGVLDLSDVGNFAIHFGH